MANKPYISSTQVASSVPFDNSTNDFVSTDVQAAIEEVKNLSIQQIVWVAKNGNDTTGVVGEMSRPFLTITAAYAAITDNSATKRYVIEIAPGTYTENNPIVMKDFVHLVGQGGPRATTVSPANANADLFTGANSYYMHGLYLTGVTGTGKCLINQPGATTAGTINNIDGCRFGNTDTILKLTGSTSDTNVFIHECVSGLGDSFKNGFYVVSASTGESYIRLVSFVCDDIDGTVCNYAGYASGAQCRIGLENCCFIVKTAPSIGSCLQADTGASIDMDGGCIEGFAKAFYSINTGAGPDFDLTAINLDNNTVDFQINNTGTTGCFLGTSNTGVTNNSAPLTFFVNWTNENNGDFTMDGASIPTRRVDQVTLLSTPFTANTHTLLYTDTTVYYISGSSTGQTLELPNATSIRIGFRLEIYNQGSVGIQLQDAAGNNLIVLAQTSVTKLILYSNGTAAGVWLLEQTQLNAPGSIITYQLTSQTAFTTSSQTDVIITAFTLTPQSGTYGIWYNASSYYTSTPKSHWWSVYKGGSQLGDSERLQDTGHSSQNMTDSTMTYSQFNGSQTCDIRVRCDSTGSLTVNSRTLIMIRLGI